MALARWGEESDVYVYSDGDTYHCEHMDKESYSTNDPELMIIHLIWHRHINKDKVPSQTLDRLSAEGNGMPYETEVQHTLDELLAELEKVKRTDG